MKVYVDCREHALYEKLNEYMILNSPSVIQLYSKNLDIGDIKIYSDDDNPVYIIERKTFPDLLASIKDGRYKEQSHRLLYSSGFNHHNILYILEGSFSNLKTPLEKKIIYASLTSLNYFKGFSVMRTSSVQETAELIFFLSEKIDAGFSKRQFPLYLFDNNKIPAIPLSSQNGELNIVVDKDTIEETKQENDDLTKEKIEGSQQTNASQIPYVNFVKKVKKDNITQENIGEIILSQIPSVSSNTAILIMKKYKSLYEFIVYLKQNPNCLDNLETEITGGKKRKISKSAVMNIKKYLFGEN
jgi:ERCC4-type nuclease